MKGSKRDLSSLEKYLNQKLRLPKVLESQFNEKIIFYNYVDLNPDFILQEGWFILTKSVAAYYIYRDDEYKLEVQANFSDIKVARETRTLSGGILKLYDEDRPIFILRHSHRQKVTMGKLKYLIEQSQKNDVKKIFETFNADADYEESILKPISEAQNTIKAKDKKTLTRLLSYLKPYKKELLLGFVGAVLSTFVALIPAYLSGYLIDEVIKPFQDNVLNQKEAISLAFLAVGTLALAYIFREFFMWIRLKKMSILGEKVARDLRKELYSHLQTLSMDFYSKKQTGSIISRVTSDTDRIWDFIAFGVVEVSISIITLIALSSVLIFLDWRLGLILTVPVPLFLYCIYYYGEVMQKLFIRIWRKWSSMTAVLSDTIPGIQVVKAFNQEAKEIKRFNNRNEVVTEETFNLHRVWTSFWPVLMLVIQLLMVAVWYFAMPRLLGKEDMGPILSAGTFVSFLLYMTMFIHPIEIIGQVARMLNRALSSAYRIFEILDTSSSIKEKDDKIVLNNMNADIEFKNVFFSYDGVRQVINDLSLKVS